MEIVPSAPEVEPLGTVEFAVSVDGKPESSASWAVMEPGGGMIDSSGTYTAPDTEGTYTILASLGSVLTSEVTQVRVKRNVRVSVSPSTATLAAGESLTLTASVTGNVKTVDWTIEEAPNGGTVTAAGVYTAPLTAGTYHVVATSKADPTKSDAATVTVTAPLPPPPPPPEIAITVAPQSASVLEGGTVQLTATVTGSTDLGVGWSVSESGGGMVTSSGLYTAPTAAGTFHVVAASHADPTKTASTLVTVVAPPPPPPPPSGVFAFPGAQGGGALSKGGRGGVVYEVTNLNDTGTGSLRACIAASGPRTCVFRVGGTIQLASTLKVVNPYLTVAGQTAPGGGIQISGKSIASTVLLINTHDVVWRYTRIRKGYLSGGTGNADGVDVHVPGAYNIVLDHNSVQWAQDENMGLWGGPHNVTVSWNLLAEPLYNHPTQLLTGANDRATADTMVEIDFHHNFLSSSGHRNPLMKHKSGSWVNGIVYNICNFATQIGGGAKIDIVNNVYKRGPLQLSGGECAGYADPSGNLKHSIEVFPGGSSECSSGSPSLFVSGNVEFGASAPATDSWSLMYEVTGEGGTEIGPLSTAYRRTTPRASPVVTVTPDATARLADVMLPTVGASRLLDCSGAWISARDSVDARLINEFLTTTGPKTRPSVEPGWPTIQGGTPCADSDHDGMPDLWESAQGLNPKDASDRNALGSDGYTNLERYLNGQ